jgi:hypothetical protein
MPLHVVSPFVTIQSLGRGTLLASGVWNALFNLALGLPFLGLARLVLPRRVMNEGIPSLATSTRNRLARIPGLRAWFRLPPLRGNPVAWRDVHYVYGGHKHEWILCLLAAFAIAAIAWCVALVAGLEPFDALMAALIAVAVGGGIVCSVLPVVRAARALNGEKADRTIDMLLVSGLSDGEIVSGKIRAICTASLPWLAVTGAAAAGAVAVGRAWIGLFYVAGYTVYFVGAVFAFVSLALLLSLRMKAGATLGICVVGFFVWNSCAKQFALMPFGVFVGVLGSVLAPALMPVLIFLPSMLLDVGLAALTLHLLVTDFRWKILKEP